MLESVSLFVAKTIASYAFQKGLNHFFENMGSFENRLSKVIDLTIEEFKAENPIPDEDEKFVFYDSQIIVDELLKYRFFGSTGYQLDEARISSELNKNSNIIQPEKKQLESFLEIFEQKIQKDDQLKKLAVDENYKSEIFNISDKIDTLLIKLSEEHSRTLKEINQRQENYLTNLDSLLKDNYSPFERLMFKEIFLEKWKSLEKEVETLNLVKKEREKLLSALHKGEYENAEKNLISITNKEAYELSKTIYELGNVYFIQHKLNKALECFQKASELNPSEPAYLTEIGNIYSIIGNLKKAYEFQLRAFTLARKQLETDHPNIGLILNFIGIICSKKGQHNEAIEYFLSALSILEKHIKFDHPSIGSIYNNLGIEYETIGEKEKAIHYTENALKSFQNFSGKEDDPTVQLLEEGLRKLKK